jgi:alanine racemase
MQIQESSKEENKTYAIVHLDNISHNYHYVKEMMNGKRVMAVIKADGYGHGAIEIAERLQSEGADTFAVANLGEALVLRDAGIHGLILILGYTLPESLKYAIEKDISVTVASLESLFAVETEAKRLNKKAKIHIKLDTGMNRTGFDVKFNCLPQDLSETAKRIKESQFIISEGIFTHFAVADEPESDFTELQFERYQKSVEALSDFGCSFQIHHVCNSAGTFYFLNMHLDMVRLGINLYGCCSDDKNILPAMEFKTTVIRVNTVLANEGIGYGLAYQTNETRKIATIAAGYADGFPRILSNKGRVLIHGKYAPITGRICMDMAMVDVTDIEDVKIGDNVTIFGKDKEGVIRADEVADLCGTISYEILCSIGKRVKRVYKA